MIQWFACVDAFAAASSNPYLDELIARARANKLADRREWHILGHYQPAFFTRKVRSLADDKAFFHAANGKHDPHAELEATLASFFSTEVETDRTQNPQCRFIRRYRWLKEQLAFDPKRLRESPCNRYEAWRSQLEPHSVTLVFPAAYVNSPASMYGHTLIRIDGPEQTDKSKLLGYAVNYAAFLDESNAILFAIKGLMGGYPGRFSMTPYYNKVAEYSDIESRDIWEYQLTLTPVEIDRMLEHVWELGPINFDYYFFDENCSYKLLWLIDVARPSLRLTDQFPLWAIPADTVRVVVNAPGLVKRTEYRPSKRAEVKHFAASLEAGEVTLSRALADGKLSASGDWRGGREQASQARVLDLGYELLDYRRLAGRTSPTTTPARLRELLLARSQVNGPAPPEPSAPAIRPDQGHASARLSAGGGTIGGDGFQELRFRATYHEFIDPSAGYQSGAQIEFGNIALRHENDRGSLSVERATFVDVASIAPWDDLDKPISWRFDFGFERTRFRDGTRPTLFQAGGGGGVATMIGPNITAFALLEASTIASTRLDQTLMLGLGPRAGAIIEVTPRWRMQFTARTLSFFSGGDDRRDLIGLHQNVSLTRDFSLRIETDIRREFGARWSTVGAYMQYYF